ncbi:MAG: HAD family hydrolase [Planctomycetota bacterium]|nr:HAD family hydrolase [Planctomycetota bacterium]
MDGHEGGIRDRCASVSGGPDGSGAGGPGATGSGGPGGCAAGRSGGQNVCAGRPLRRAVFLDRDGVINVSPGEGKFVLRVEDFRPAEDAAEALARLRAAGFLLIVVTNQSCVGRGLLDASALDRIHDHMRELLAGSGAAPDAVYCCPHSPEAGCDCRKPEPGMLLRAAHEFGINLSASWMVGDSARDIETGRAAGCRTILLIAGAPGGATAAGKSPAPDAVARSLGEAAAVILGEAGQRR